MAFYWFRLAWRIFINKDYSEVALKRGLPPANPEKFATITGVVNILAGVAAVWIIIGVMLLIASGIMPGDDGRLMVNFDKKKNKSADSPTP